MKNHDGNIRGFYHLSEAWYGPSNLQNSQYTDEVNFGFFCPSGGTSGEMCLRWQRLGDKNVPKLECFSDAWHTLASFTDLIAAMGELDDKTQPQRNSAISYRA